MEASEMVGSSSTPCSCCCCCSSVGSAAVSGTSSASPCSTGAGSMTVASLSVPLFSLAGVAASLGRSVGSAVVLDAEGGIAGCCECQLAAATSIDIVGDHSSGGAAVGAAVYVTDATDAALLGC